MNFPVFGDAGVNTVRGQGCAAILENGASVFSCPDIYPLGKIIYFALPFYISKDPVVADHLTLGLKILVFILFVSTLMSIFRTCLEASGPLHVTPRQYWASAILITVGLLVISVNNIPVRLTDIEAACCAVISVFFALIALRDATERDSINHLAIFWTCFFACLASLFKQSFIVREALLVLAFALCLRPQTLLRFLKDWRVYAIGAFANFGVGLQMLYVWWQFGAIGLTQPRVMENVAIASRFPYVAMEIYTAPANGAYMLSVQQDTSWISWHVYKVYYALVTNDLFVYGGFAKARGYLLTSNLAYWSLVYLTVIIFFALMAASIRYGSRTVRFISLVALFNVLFMTAYQHVEPRYYIFPKALLIVLAASWALKGWTALPLVRAPKRAIP